MLEYLTVQELVSAAEAAKESIGVVVMKDQARQMETEEREVYKEMEARLQVMEEAVKKGMVKGLRSTSGLSGGDGYRMMEYAEKGGMTGSFMTRVMARALAVSEYNASMGKIVAAPTAGSCGIMPACLIGLLEDHQTKRENVVAAMFTAAAFGMVIARNASVSGAEGGCQAECGSAAGMTAAALVEIMGGTPSQAADACAIAIKNQMGLVCDPVAGLVEIPCIKRNVAGAMIAFSSAEMALAGIQSKIPADEVIGAMKEVGDSMPCAMKETARGGLAATVSGQRMREQVFGEETGKVPSPLNDEILRR